MRLAEGDCYRAAARLLLSMGNDALLVHGNVTGQGRLAGVRYDHAWVEINGAVIDASNGRAICMPQDEYYALGCIERVRRYPRSEVLRWMAESKHYGPWEEWE